MRTILVSVAFSVVFGAVLAGCAVAEDRAPAPAAPQVQVPAPAPAFGAGFTGPDVLWRPRENLVFHMLDERGDGFALDFTVRDMNTYMQMPSETVFWVVGPRDETLARHILEDDGVVAGNDRWRDGNYDVYMDYRYREWHRVHSPGGYPPGKERSPFLANPERLPARHVRVRVPAAGPGLYRVKVMGRWDHWISMTPDRPIPTGVHPGAGPLYVHGDRLNEAYLYVPEGAQEVGLSLTEEIQPFNWTARVETLDGREIAATPEPQNFLQFAIFEPAAHGGVYRLRVQGDTTGACLHIRGVPFVLAPDAETARLLRGGVQVDERGRWVFHHHKRALLAWADGLSAEDLAVEERPVNLEAVEDRRLSAALEVLPDILDAQSVDPDAAAYGRLARGPLGQLGLLAGTEHPENPYFGDLALVRRVLLGTVHSMQRLSPYWWYDTNYDFPRRFQLREDALFSVPMRSNWYSLGADSWHSYGAVQVVPFLEKAMPPEAAAAWKRSYDIWNEARWHMHSTEVSNQWLYNMVSMLRNAQITGDDTIAEVVRGQLRSLLTPGLYGRRNPDPAVNPAPLGYTAPADSGRMRMGILAEAQGWDANYAAWCQENSLRTLYDYLEEDAIIEYLEHYGLLKGHVIMPKGGEHVAARWQAICGPTDVNFRTEGQPLNDHTGRFPDDVRGRIPYADLEDTVWPCLEEEPFVRGLDDFWFVNTGQYYAISYAGHTNPDHLFFMRAVVGEGTASLEGYSAGRMRQRKTTKPGALSGLYVRNCGPTLLGQNYDIMFSNALWGRVAEPVSPVWGDSVDPRLVSSAFVDARVEFDPDGRVMRRSGRFFYAPLHFTTTHRFRDDRISVTVELLAMDDVELEELYEAFPYYADNRLVRVWDGDWAERTLLDGSGRADTSGRAEEPRETLPLRAFDVASPGGPGTAFIFDRAYSATRYGAYRYRSIAAASGSLSIQLPPRLKAGESVTYRYVIYSRQNAVDADDLRRVAAEEGF